MIQSSKNKGYTASDIERYHTGRMSPAEMHALEKAALDDPFLADAVEGYTYTSTPATDIRKIQERLNGKTERRKAAPVFLRSYNWMKAAAILIILAGGSWLAFSLLDNKSNKSLAVEKTHYDSNKTLLPPATVTSDTASLVKTDGQFIIKPDQPSARNTRSPRLSSDTDRNRNSFATHMDAREEEFKKQSNEYRSNPSANNNAVVMNNRTMPNAEAMNNASGRRDINFQKERAVNSDTASSQVVALEKNSNRSLSPDTVKNLNVVMHRIPGSPPEEVVVLNQPKRKAEVQKMQVKVDTLEPEQGWARFDDYIAGNIQTPDELRNKPERGEVELSFDIDKKGQPVNITVVRSLCDKCDEEAIRLLKEGPKWKKMKNKKGTVTIRF